MGHYITTFFEMTQCYPAFSNEDEVIFVEEIDETHTSDSSIKTLYIDPDEVTVKEEYDEIVDGEQQVS